jgi:hypothetical protein
VRRRRRPSWRSLRVLHILLLTGPGEPNPHAPIPEGTGTQWMRPFVAETTGTSVPPSSTLGRSAYQGCGKPVVGYSRAGVSQTPQRSTRKGGDCPWSA